MTADDARPAALTQKPTWLISEVARVAHRLLTDELATAGSRGYHYRLLAALTEFGPASQASLGRHTGMDRSDVVASVNELAGSGLVDRSPDPADRRRNIITITAAGTARLQRLEELLAGVQDRLAAPLSSAERGQLIRLLTRILDHHAPGSLPRAFMMCSRAPRGGRERRREPRPRPGRGGRRQAARPRSSPGTAATRRR